VRNGRIRQFQRIRLEQERVKQGHGCLLVACGGWDTGQGCPVNRQAGKPALHGRLTRLEIYSCSSALLPGKDHLPNGERFLSLSQIALTYTRPPPPLLLAEFGDPDVKRAGV